MSTKANISIRGVGKYVPPQKVVSEDLERALNIPLGFSEKYSGVSTRYHVEEDTVSTMGAKAAESALKNAGCAIEDMDLLLCACVSFDYILPNRASLVLAELAGGQECRIPTLDVNNSCLSFVSGLELASHLLKSDQYNRILLVTSEVSSKHLDAECFEVATLFGDGAVAVVLEDSPDSRSEIIASRTESYVEGINFSVIKGGGIKYPVRDYPYDSKLYSFQMNGRNLLKMAHKLVPTFTDQFLKQSGVQAKDIDLVIPHQASKMGLKMFEKIMPFKPEQVYNILDHYGNCISASIPLALCEAIESKRLVRGQKCLLMGSAAGLSLGALLFRY